METKWRFKTKEKFIKEDKWCVNKNVKEGGTPYNWNNSGEMNKYLGQPIPSQYNTYCETSQSFSTPTSGWGRSWRFGSSSYTKEPLPLNLCKLWPIEGKCKTTDDRLEQFLISKFGLTTTQTSKKSAEGIAWNSTSYWWVLSYNRSSKPEILLDEILPFFDKSKSVKDFVLPEKWCVKRTDKNYTIINKYFNETFGNCYEKNLSFPYIPYTKSKYNKSLSVKPDGYTEITFEQFQQYVLGKDLQSTTKPITENPISFEGRYLKCLDGSITFPKKVEVEYNKISCVNVKKVNLRLICSRKR